MKKIVKIKGMLVFLCILKKARVVIHVSKYQAVIILKAVSKKRPVGPTNTLNVKPRLAGFLRKIINRTSFLRSYFLIEPSGAPFTWYFFIIYTVVKRSKPPLYWI